MKPYYQSENVTLYHGDCREILPQMKSGSADLVITSPPYNMRTRIRNGEYTERETSEHFSKKYADFHDALPINDYYELHKQVITESLRIAHLSVFNIQVVTGSKEAWFKLIGDFNTALKDMAIWDKGEGQPAMHENVMNRASELILFFESGASAGRAFAASHFDRGTMSDIWRFGRGGKNKVAGHAATFPIEIPVKVIVGWTSLSETVLDPFCGSGTTAIAAIKTERKFIGCEISEKYCEIAARRIERELAQGKLFEPERPEPARQMELEVTGID